MEEQKVTKKASSKKTSSNKKKTEKVNETKVEKTNEIKLEDIPQDVIEQIFNMFKSVNKENEEIKLTTEEKPSKITKGYLRKIKDKEVVVRSLVGLVVFKSPKTNIVYKWTDVGDEEVLTIDEILQMDTTSKRFLHTPWLLIDDKDVVEGLGLSNLYSIIEKAKDLDSLLELEMYEIEEIINALPHDFKQELSNKVFVKVSNDEIRDILVIRKLEDLLKNKFTI